LEDGTTPVANKTYIYSGKNWKESVFPQANNDSQNNLECININVNYQPL